MDIFTLTLVTFFWQVIMAERTVETYEKFYTADILPRLPGIKRQHGNMGISTVARFSMLSNTPTLFKVKRPGLQDDANTVSFESIQKPGHYLRYKNYKFHMEKLEDSVVFENDASFRERQGPRGRAYELLGRDNWFICHSDDIPYTLKAKSEKIGTAEFVQNCVYVPVKQTYLGKKNIVKTAQTGESMVVNSVPSTQIADKCIGLRFVNKLGGPVRVVSSLKPEGYLVTANAFKLKTIFKHANHKQRHVIFYAENIQDRDDDVLLNGKNVFTVKPNECGKEFEDVVLLSSQGEPALGNTTPKPQATNAPTENPAINAPTESAKALASSTSIHTSLTQNTPQPPAISGDTPKPPAINYAPKPPAINSAPKPPAMNYDTPKPPAINYDTPKPPAINYDTPKPPAINYDTPKPPAINSAPKPPAINSAPKPPAINYDTPKPPAINYDKPSTPNLKPGITGSTLSTGTPQRTNSFRVGSPIKSTQQTQTFVKAVTRIPGQAQNNYLPNTLASSHNTRNNPTLEKQIHNLNNVFEDKVQRNAARPFLGGESNMQGLRSGYDAWSSFGPCSVSCGVGFRRRTRVCPPSTYCSGTSAETRACIKEQCVSKCVHTIGGTVRRGSCCHFPFTFNGGDYSHCIVSPRSNDRLWCSTTPYFDQDKQWGYCPQSAKAPVRSIKMTKPAQPVPQPAQQPYVAPNAAAANGAYSSHYYIGGFNDPSTAYKTNNIPCHPMCSSNCLSTCPKQCCSSRVNLPYNAYIGSNFTPTDRRSSIYPYQPRYGRSLSKKKIKTKN